MRFRLRTLLILVTVVCVYAAWVGYMRNAAALHGQEANRIARELAQSTSMTTKDLEVLITNIAAQSTARVDKLSFGSVDTFLGEARLAEHRKAVNHTILANTYDQSILRPWKIFGAHFSP